MSSKLVVLLGVSLSGVSLSAWAHHSFPAHYVADQSVTVEGVVAEFLWRNPHAFIHLKAMNEAGEPEVWALEWHNTIILTRMGYGPDTIRPGEKVIVSGNPSRDGSRRIRMVTLERPADGFSLSRSGGQND